MSNDKYSVWFTYKNKEGKLVSIHMPNLYKNVEELEKKHRHLDKRMDGWVSQIIIYKRDIDDKYYDQNQEINELKDRIEMAELRGDNINERVDNLEKSEDKFMRQLTFIQKGFIVNKEVLREDYKFKIKNLPDNDLKKHYESLLKKLTPSKKTRSVKGIYTANEMPFDPYDPILKKELTPSNICFKCGSILFSDGICGICTGRTKGKEPTDVAGSARQTEFELIEKFIPPRGITCKDCMNMGKNELKILKADLEFLFKYGDGNYEPCGHDDDDFFDLRKKYLEEVK